MVQSGRHKPNSCISNPASCADVAWKDHQSVSLSDKYRFGRVRNINDLPGLLHRLSEQHALLQDSISNGKLLGKTSLIRSHEKNEHTSAGIHCPTKNGPEKHIDGKENKLYSVNYANKLTSFIPATAVKVHYVQYKLFACTRWLARSDLVMWVEV